jgi:hypothetical protein
VYIHKEFAKLVRDAANVPSEPSRADAPSVMPKQ